MSIPDYQKIMLPLLESVADGAEYRLRDLIPVMCDRFHLSEEERTRLLPSGNQTAISNRVGWARTYLSKAGLVQSIIRGSVQITEAGRRVLEKKPSEINARFLEQFPSYIEFKKKHRVDSGTDEVEVGIGAKPAPLQTPEDAIEDAYQQIREDLADAVLERVRSCSPQFFERLVVKLLVAMGYGGSLEDAGKAVGRVGDGGIDGIIKEDRLGLDVVCIQAKRWESNVGRPQVQAFAGSMEGHRAKKGVLLTTAKFSKDATDYVDRIERKIGSSD